MASKPWAAAERAPIARGVCPSRDGRRAGRCAAHPSRRSPPPACRPRRGYGSRDASAAGRWHGPWRSRPAAPRDRGDDGDAGQWMPIRRNWRARSSGPMSRHQRATAVGSGRSPSTSQASHGVAPSPALKARVRTRLASVGTGRPRRCAVPAPGDIPAPTARRRRRPVAGRGTTARSPRRRSARGGCRWDRRCAARPPGGRRRPACRRSGAARAVRWRHPRRRPPAPSPSRPGVPAGTSRRRRGR